MKTDENRDLQKELEQLMENAPEEPHQKEYRVNDTTIEALLNSLTHNTRGILLYRDELSGMMAQWEMPGHDADRGILLEAWNGSTRILDFVSEEAAGMSLSFAPASSAASSQPSLSNIFARSKTVSRATVLSTDFSSSAIQTCPISVKFPMSSPTRRAETASSKSSRNLPTWISQVRCHCHQ